MIICGDVFDVAVCIRTNCRNDIPSKFCGVALCVAGKWLGDINGNIPINTVLGEMEDVLKKEEVLKSAQIDPSLSRLFPDNLNQALAVFFGDGIVMNGKYIFSLSEYGAICNLEIGGESMECSVFAVTHENDMRVFVINNRDTSQSFIHDTKKSDFFSTLRRSHQILSGIKN